MTDGEHFAVAGFLEQPVDRLVAGPAEIGDQADPIVVHVDAQRCCRSVVGELAGLLSYLGQIHAVAAKLLRYGDQQVVALCQLVEILLAEAVLAVVFGSPLGEAREHFLIKREFLGHSRGA